MCILSAGYIINLGRAGKHPVLTRETLPVLPARCEEHFSSGSKCDHQQNVNIPTSVNICSNCNNVNTSPKLMPKRDITSYDPLLRGYLDCDLKPSYFF